MESLPEGKTSGQPGESNAAQRQTPSWRFGLAVVLVGVGVALSGWTLLQPRSASCARTKSSFVGAHRCKSCHQEAYKKWQSTGHARAFKLLGNSKRDLSCLRCHSTGTAMHLQGVQCESCHGGGRYYIRPEVMIDPLLARTVGLKVIKGKAGCVQCHTKQTIKHGKFDYAKMWAKIAHGKK